MYIVTELGNNRARYQQIADDESATDEVRQEAQTIANYMTLLLCRIANGSVTFDPEDQS